MVKHVAGMPPLVSLKGVSVVAASHAGRQTILDAVNLEIHAGERVVILGANGAGKSTLLKLCNGIVSATSGTATTLPVHEQALIFQRPALLRRSVIDNVRFVLRARGVAEPECARAAQQALAACDLSAFAEQHARLLSGGEQQRLALARAWACAPRLLLADEPTANLAPAATREVERLLLHLHASGAAGSTEISTTQPAVPSRALMLSTHNVAQAKRMASRIVFLNGGQVVEDRPAAEFFASPQSAAARSYLEGESL